MVISQKDISAVEHIIKYCNEIEQMLIRFGNKLETLQNDFVFKNASAMCILQIGELTTHFSEEFTKEYNKMDWKRIKAMRNIAAHNYGTFNSEVLHKTMIEDIPELKAYCEKIIAVGVLPKSTNKAKPQGNFEIDF